MTLAEHELRGQILGRAAQSERALHGGHLLGEAKVHQLEVAVGGHEEILGLEVAIRVAQRVHVSQGQNDVGGVESGRLGLDATNRARGNARALGGVRVEGGPELAARHVLHDEVERAGILSGRVQLDDERAIELEQCLALAQYVSADTRQPQARA